MLTATSFSKAAADLAAANNLPLDRAEHYLALIGDTPEFDADGKIVVRDDNDVELARLTATPELSSLI